MAASFQQAVIEVLVDKSIRLAKEKGTDKIAIAGGVAANEGLRQLMKRGKGKYQILYPSRILCTDNAALIDHYLL